MKGDKTHPGNAWTANLDDLLWAEWSDANSLFHRGTGETHLLDAFSSEVAHKLCEHPLTLSKLSQLLARECEMEDSSAWRQKIARILHNLHALYIVEKYPWPDSPTFRDKT